MEVMEAIKRAILAADPERANKAITLPTKSARTEEWLSWYRGKVQGFHNYQIFNGNNYIDYERKSLGMAKKVCEDWANLLANEKCDITIPEANKANEKLQALIKSLDFWVKANGGVEKAFALGFGCFVMNVINIEQGELTKAIRATPKTKITLDFVNARRCTPICVENRNITECAFESATTEEKMFVVHIKNAQGNYIVYNLVWSNSQNRIENEYMFDTKSPLPWFATMRPNIESNVMFMDKDDEIGMSIYANALDNFRAVDNKYDSFDFEYVASRKRLFVAASLWKVSKDSAGKMQRTFDPMDATIQYIPQGDDGKNLIEEKGGDIRAQAFIDGIKQELNYLSSKCGFGENYYRFDGGQAATATQVVSENSTLFRSVKKHELVLESCIRTIVQAMIFASNQYTLDPIGEIKPEDIVIRFDDSIIEDKNAEITRDRTDVAAGLMSKAEYRMKWYGEDETTANQKVASDPQSWLDLADKGFIPPYMAIAKKLNITNEEAKAMYAEEQLRRTESAKAAASMYEPDPQDEEDNPDDEEDPEVKPDEPPRT